MMKILSVVAALLIGCAPALAQTPVQFGAGTVLGNSTASRAPGSPITPSALLDRAISSTQGAVLTRQGSAWAGLPPGTVGLPLLSGGAAANLAYGILGLSGGGTAAALSASNGGIVYSGASALAVLAGSATARQMLQSGASGAPAWSTATWPATTTINQILFSSSANVVGGLATANNGVLITSAGGVPSIATAIPAGVTIAAAGLTGQVALSAGGTAASLTASNGGIVYSGASAFAVLAGTSSAGQCLISGSNAAPSWGSCAAGGTVSSFNSRTGAVVPVSGDYPASLVPFTQSGTGAVATTADAVFKTAFIIPEQFGAVGDGTTDDGPALRLAITNAQSTGRPIYLLNKYGFCPDGANAWGLQITSAIRMEGWGVVGPLPKGWLFPLASGCGTAWTSAKDLIYLRGSSASALTYSQFRNFTLGNAVSPQGRHGIYIDTRGGSASFGYARFDLLNVLPTNNLAFYQQNDNTEAIGGMYESWITGGTYNNGIKYTYSGSGNGIKEATIQGTGIGVQFDGAAGLVGFYVEKNNISTSGGGVQIDSGDGVLIAGNEIEITGSATVTSGCMVNIAASSGTTSTNNTVIRDNGLVNLTSGTSLLNHVCIASAANNARVDTNAWYSSNATQISSGHWITNAGTATQINANQYYQPSTVTAANAISDTGTTTLVPVMAERSPVADTNYTVTRADWIVAYTSISAARTVSLPAAAAFSKGRRVCIRDDSGSASATKTISAAPAGTDTIQGSNTTQVVVNQAQGEACLESNGSAGWFIPLVSVSGDATGNISQGNTLPLTLATVNSNVGSCGDATHVCQVTLNGKGLATAASAVAITSGICPAWTTYTPTITAAGGTFTTVAGAGQYCALGKTLFVNIDVTVTTVGTATSYIKATLPGGIILAGTQSMSYSDSNVLFGSAQANGSIPAFILAPSTGSIGNNVYHATGSVQLN